MKIWILAGNFPDNAHQIAEDRARQKGATHCVFINPLGGIGGIVGYSVNAYAYTENHTLFTELISLVIRGDATMHEIEDVYAERRRRFTK